MYPNHIAGILRHLGSVALLGNFVEQARLGLLDARLLLGLLQPCLRCGGILGRALHHEIILQVLVYLVLGHLGLAVTYVLHGLTDPNQLYGHTALADVVTDVVTESIRNLGALLLVLEHGRVGRGIFDLRAVASGQTDAVLLGTFGGDCLGALAALGHEVLAQHFERFVVLLRSLTHRTFLDTLVDGLEIEGDVPHFKIYTVTNVRTQHIRQRVEFGKAAHTDTAALVSAGGQDCGTRKRRGKKNLFHRFLNMFSLIV